MAIEYKVRPTMSIRDLAIIAKSLDEKMLGMINEGKANSPLLLDLIRIKTYCESFQPKTNNAEALLAAYLKNNAAQGNVHSHDAQEINPLALAQAEAEISRTADTSFIEDIVSSTTVSPIDNPALTDEQRYDLLSLKTDKQRTSEENKWFLNVGTLVMMKRAGLANKSIDEGNL